MIMITMTDVFFVCVSGVAADFRPGDDPVFGRQGTVAPSCSDHDIVFIEPTCRFRRPTGFGIRRCWLVSDGRL